MISFTQTPGNFAKRMQWLQTRGMYIGIGRMAMQIKPKLLQYLREEAPKGHTQHMGAYSRALIAKQYASALTHSIDLKYYGPSPLSQSSLRGTAAHRIPKTGNKLLHFFVGAGGGGLLASGGTEVYAMHVQHPGTKPNNFVHRAVERIKPDLHNLYAQEMGAVIRHAITG